MSRTQLHTGLLALVYSTCSAMLSGFSLFCLAAYVKNKATHAGRKSAVLFLSKCLSFSFMFAGMELSNQNLLFCIFLFVCLQIWGSVQHKGGQALAILDKKLQQTLFPNPKHCFLCLQIWGSVQHEGVQALATLDEKLEQSLFP